MSFWDFMNRMLVGKPIFDRRDFHDEEGRAIPVDESEIYPESRIYSPRPSHELPVDEHGQEMYPALQIVQSGIHESGEDYLDLWVTIKNTSDRLIELENTDIIGQNMRCTYRFTPGQQRQVEVYKGSVPKDDNYKYAYLYYKEIKSGHYFKSMYQIVYHIEHSTRFLPQNFRLLRVFKNA